MYFWFRNPVLMHSVTLYAECSMCLPPCLLCLSICCPHLGCLLVIHSVLSHSNPSSLKSRLVQHLYQYPSGFTSKGRSIRHSCHFTLKYKSRSIRRSRRCLAKYKSRPIRRFSRCLSKYKSRPIRRLRRCLSKYKSRPIRRLRRCLSKYKTRPIRRLRHCLFL